MILKQLCKKPHTFCRGAILSTLLLSIACTNAIAATECKVTYTLAGDGRLQLPCVEVLNTTNRAVYTAELQLTDAKAFLFAIVPSSVKPVVNPSEQIGAIYDLVGRGLRIPQVNVITPTGETLMYEVTFQTLQNGLLGLTQAKPITPTTGNNHPPIASPASLQADSALPYQEIKLIGTDPDNDTLAFELLAPPSGTGYSFAYLNPLSHILYVTIAGDFNGTISLPYRVTDGKLFSDPVAVTISATGDTQKRELGSRPVEPRIYAGFPTTRVSRQLLGTPGGGLPKLPSHVDLSSNFPIPGNQGEQNSCVGWAVGYALKSYQERLENEGWSLNTTDHLFSPAFIYNQINEGRDQGAVISDALDLLTKKGAATLSTVPYNDRDFAKQPAAPAFEQAANYKLKTWGTLNTTVDMKAALANRLPVLTSIPVFQSLLNLKGPDAVYNTASGDYLGVHAVTIVGYDDERYGGAFKIINSWGTAWGDKGFFWLPYNFATTLVQQGDRNAPVLSQAYAAEDAENKAITPPSSVLTTEPPPSGDLPNLQVVSWNANYDNKPGGEGKWYYTVANTGKASVEANLVDVNLMLSTTPTISSNDTYIVFETIPVALAPGGSATRDANNPVSFKLPSDLKPGNYYMSVWIDDLNKVAESNKDDNIAPSEQSVNIISNLPDLQIDQWYAEWNANGEGKLQYSLSNQGATAVNIDGWDISLVLLQQNNVDEGDAERLFQEGKAIRVRYNLASGSVGFLEPGQSIVIGGENSASFNLYTDDMYHGLIPSGIYYLALWVDSFHYVQEADHTNNISFGSNLVKIGGARQRQANTGGKTYNGKPLPESAITTRKIRVNATPEGGRTLEFLDESPQHTFAKTVRAAQQVVFPITDSISLPAFNQTAPK